MNTTTLGGNSTNRSIVVITHPMPQKDSMMFAACVQNFSHTADLAHGISISAIIPFNLGKCSPTNIYFSIISYYCTQGSTVKCQCYQANNV